MSCRRVYATSDTHGNLPQPPADAEIILMAGDLCPDFLGGWYSGSRIKRDDGHQRQANWLKTQFKPWTEALGIPIIATWGNHDFVGEHPHLVPEISNLVWLCDEITEVSGLTIWGTPWVPRLTTWAFYARDEALEARAELIPAGLDVLMTHGPPFAVADGIPPLSRFGNGDAVESVGDRTLNDVIRRAAPTVTICGHIHEARGSYTLGGNEVLNVSAVDEYYELHDEPWVLLDGIEASNAAA